MCKLRRKLLLFDYIIEKLVDWQAQIEWQKQYNELKRVQINEILGTLSGKRLMKLLYFICLSSVHEDTQRTQDSLFGIFDRYIAMENGPVEDSVYHNRGILLRYTFDNELKLSDKYQEHFKFNYPDVDENAYNKADIYRVDILNEQLQNPKNNKEIDETNLTLYAKMVDKSIEHLRNKKTFPFEDKELLIQMTHELPLWNKYINKNDTCIQLDNIEELKYERHCFDELLG